MQGEIININCYKKGIRSHFLHKIVVISNNSVSIVIRHGLDGPGSNPGGGEIFHNRPDGSWGPPSLLYNGYRVFPGGKAAGAWR